jgi:hypothetical protein
MRDPAMDPHRAMFGRALLATVAFVLFAIGALAAACWTPPGNWAGAALAVLGVGVALYSVAASSPSIVHSSRRLVDIFVED